MKLTSQEFRLSAPKDRTPSAHHHAPPRAILSNCSDLDVFGPASSSTRSQATAKTWAEVEPDAVGSPRGCRKSGRTTITEVVG